MSGMKFANAYKGLKLITLLEMLNIIGVLMATALGIIFLFFRLRVISAVENIAHKTENADMSGKAKIFSVILIILMIITIIITAVTQAVPAVSLLVGIIGNGFGIVKSMVFVAYLTKALKMLKK